MNNTFTLEYAREIIEKMNKESKELVLDFFKHGENISFKNIKKDIKKWHNINITIDQIKAIKQIYID